MTSELYPPERYHSSKEIICALHLILFSFDILLFHDNRYYLFCVTAGVVARPLLYSIVIYLIMHHIKQFVWFIGSHCGWVQNSVASVLPLYKKVEQSMCLPVCA